MVGTNPRLTPEQVAEFFKSRALDNECKKTMPVSTTMEHYQNLTRALRVSPNPDDFFGLTYVISKLAGEAGEISDQFGKAIRDDDLAADLDIRWTHCMTAFEPRRIDKILGEMGDVLYYLSELCKFFNITFEDLAEMNILKLSDRDSRGVLQGDGDKR